MPAKYSATTIFCESIRQEVGGGVTIVGVMPDNLFVSKVPGTFSRLSIYSRVTYNPRDRPATIAMELRDPIGGVIATFAVPPDFGVQQAGDPAINNLSLNSIIIQMNAENVPIVSSGTITAVTIVDGEETISGILNIRSA